VCPECGSPLPESGSCKAYLDEALLVEWSIPGGPGNRAHFLAVASFNLQHPAGFEREVIERLRESHAEVRAGRLRIEDLVRETRRRTNGPQRVMRGALADPSLSREHLDQRWPTSWPMTVLDVCRVEPGEYAARVEEWASATARALEGALR